MASRTKYVTQPREKIAKILQGERRFLSASDIHNQLRKGRTKVALSTVYRTLEHLMESGEVSERVDDAGRKSYVACDPAHHHHAICRTCGSIQDVACPELLSPSRRCANATVSTRTRTRSSSSEGARRAKPARSGCGAGSAAGWVFRSG